MSFIDLVEDDSENEIKNKVIDLTSDGDDDDETSSEDDDDDGDEDDDNENDGGEGDDSESSDDSALERKFLRPPAAAKRINKKNKSSDRKNKPVETKSFKMYALSGKKGNILKTNIFKKYSDDTLKRKTSSGKLFNCNTKCFKKYTSDHIKFNNKLSSMGYKDTNATNIIFDEY